MPHHRKPLQLSDAIGKDGTVYVTRSVTNLLALTTAGVFKWSFATATNFGNVALTVEGNILITDADTLYTLNQAGEVIRALRFPGTQLYDVIVGPSNNVFIASFDGKVRALNAAGNLQWLFDTGSPYFASGLAVGDDGNLCFRSHNLLYSVRADGFLQWKIASTGRDNAQIAIASNNSIYYTQDTPYIYGLKPDGSTNWLFTSTTGPSDCYPVIDNQGNIYCGTAIAFYALDRNGGVKFSLGPK